ncbi:MAG: lipase maturation factor family protein, partial [Planctomycetes bacterium]|nr:lipase maturation factor family protein [Planctomycetota bacterium]
LLCRLMFESGVVKLTWNDAASLPVANTWESLTALDFHYWTQPLPLWTSWFLNQLPCWVQKISVIGVLLVELVLPFFIFAPPLFRRIACGAFTLMMLVIVITGNYNFFNLLTILLALTLLDDACWPGFFRRRLAQQSPPKLVDRRQWRAARPESRSAPPALHGRPPAARAVYQRRGRDASASTGGDFAP